MTGARAWLALVDARPDDATAAAAVARLDDGEPLGWLAAWVQRAKPVRDALRADPGAFDPDGPATAASYVLAGRDVLFDDPVVQGARQRVLAAARPWTAVTTLVSDAVHFRGSLLAAPAGFDDPFTAIAPALRLAVGPGLIGAGPAVLPAPVIERYAGQPWPQSGF